MKVEMKQIVKDFGPVRAVDHVDFSTLDGEIHGLLGENGAGKSTLMNILSGTLKPSSGEIYLDGVLVTDLTPRKSSAMGLRFIHQELNLCNDLTVYENMFLGEEYKTNVFFLDKKRMIDRCAEVLARMKVEISPLDVVENLDTSQKQLVEIAKALLFESKFIIMDEPTTALNNRQIEQLFEIMRTLKSEGVTFVYISHKMPELFEICDRYTVMRDGKYIQSGYFKDINEREATELLVGRNIADTNLKESYPCSIQDQVMLETRNLSGETFSNISFSVKAGEVVSVTGLFGSGSGELAEVLFGARDATNGKISTHAAGEILRPSIGHCMDASIAMVPRNRKERGILGDLSILDNLSMAYFIAKQKNPLICSKDVENRYEENKKALNIKASNPKLPITSLSGGNQQKVILGRWLELGSDVYLLDHPTQGIDVGAKYEIYKLILDMAAQGKAIVVFSEEYPEIAQISDRCLVMYKGTMIADMQRSELDELTMMGYATGAMKEEAHA